MPSNHAIVEGLIDGFNHVVTGFALAVKTACEGTCHLVEDAYQVNVTLWDGHVETSSTEIPPPHAASKEGQSLLTLDDDQSNTDTPESTLTLETEAIRPSTGLLRHCTHYQQNPSDLRKVGIGVFACVGGIAYFLWRLSKDSAISLSLPIKAGVNDVWMATSDQLSTDDHRSIPAKVVGIFGYVIGLSLRMGLYIFAIAGFSRYGYHQLTKSLQQSAALLFGVNYQAEIAVHNEAIDDCPSRLSWLLCAVSVGKLAMLAVYGTTALLALTFGSKQSWDAVGRWIKNSNEMLFDQGSWFNTMRVPPMDKHEDNFQAMSRYVGLLPWLTGTVVILSSALIKLINLTFRGLIASEYSASAFKTTLKLTSNFLFATKWQLADEEAIIKSHTTLIWRDKLEGRNVGYQDESRVVITKPLKGYADRVGLLLRGLQVLTYACSIIVSFLFGTRASWQTAGEQMKTAVGWVVGDLGSSGAAPQTQKPLWVRFSLLPLITSCTVGLIAIALNFIGLSAMNYHWLRRYMTPYPIAPYQDANPVRQFFYHINLIKIVIGIVATIGQVLWKLTLGNVIPTDRGYDSYFNRIYYRYQSSDEYETGKPLHILQQRLHGLLRGLAYEDEDAEVPNSCCARDITHHSKDVRFSRWLLGSFAYDVKKLICFNNDTCFETVALTFSKMLQNYAERERFKQKDYAEITSAFFAERRKPKIMQEVLRTVNLDGEPCHPDDFLTPEEEAIAKQRYDKQQQVKRMVTFIEEFMCSPVQTKPEWSSVTRSSKLNLPSIDPLFQLTL